MVFPEDPIESAGAGISETGISEQSPRPEFRVSRFAAPEPPVYSPPKQRLWLHALFFVATLFTTTLVGADMQYSFNHNLPFFVLSRYNEAFTLGLQSPARFFAGLPFSLTLLTILMAHELGHYLTCVFYGLDATLPFFLPSYIPWTGTFGAFIRIRSAIRSKKTLFDVGIAGPLAGFVFLLPALGVGLAFSKVLPGNHRQETFQLGIPALQWLAQKLIFPGAAAGDIYFHPVVRAAWVGMVATSLNLIPISQLDGGHIVYATMGSKQRWITYPLLLAYFLFLIVSLTALLFSAGGGDAEFPSLGWLAWVGWLMQAIIFFFLVVGRKHPRVYDESGIGASRIKLGVLALVIFLICLPLVPVSQ